MRDRLRSASGLLGVALAIAVLASAMMALGVRKVHEALSALPAPADLSGIEDLNDAVQQEIAFPSTVVAADGTVIGRFASTTTHYTRRGYGAVTLEEATRRSINTAYVGLAEAVGVEAVAALAAAAGVESLPPPDQVGPSIAIGAYATSPLELAAAYGAFAADGHRLHPSPITTVTPSAISLDGVPAGRGARVMSADTARLVTAALQGVVTSGTGTAAAIDRPVAAKTGTSNEYADAWLVGYSPRLVAAMWVGHREGSAPMLDVNGVARVTGGSIPAAIFHDVMSAAVGGLPVLSFPPRPERQAAPPPAPVAPSTSTTATTARPSTTSSPAPTTTSPVRRPTTSSTQPAPTTSTTEPTTTTDPSTTTTTTPPTTTTTTPPTTTTSRPTTTTTRGTTTTMTRGTTTTTRRDGTTTTVQPSRGREATKEPPSRHEAGGPEPVRGSARPAA